MRRVVQFLSLAVWSAVAGHAYAADLNIMVFQGVQNIPLYVAEDKGFFANNGLTVKINIAPNSDTLRNGLIDGTYQIVHTAVDNAIALARTGKAPISIVLGGDNGFNSLFIQPNLGEIRDVKGKTLLVDAPDTAFAIVAYAMLKKNGLERGDYEIKKVGATPSRLKEMEANPDQSASSILNLPFSLLAQKAGLKEVGRAIDVIGPYLSTTGFVTQAWASEHGDDLVAYIKAYVLGLRWAKDPAHKGDVIAMIKDRLKTSDDVAAKSYEIAFDPASGLAKDAAVDMEGYRNVLRLRADFEGTDASKEPTDPKIDLSFYARALSEIDAAIRK